MPALIRSAKLSINEGQFDDAVKQADLALALRGPNADALLLKGYALIAQQDFPAARGVLEEHRKERPSSPAVNELLELCRTRKRDDLSTLLPLARVFHQEQQYAIADALLRKYGKNSREARQQLLQMYQDLIEKRAKGMGKGLTVDVNGLRYEGNSLTDVSFLHGLPLTSFRCEWCDIADLTPLKNMPLTTLVLLRCTTKIRDLTPLQGMRLTSLEITTHAGVSASLLSDLAPLRGMPLASLKLDGMGRIKDISALEGMPLTLLSLKGCGVQDLTSLQRTPLTSLDLTGCPADPAPVRAVKTLKRINDKPAEDFWKEYDAKQKGNR